MTKSVLAVLMASLTFGMASVSFAEHHEAGPDMESDERMHKHMKKRKHHREKMHKYMMKRVDTNEDGKIDLNEYMANAEQRFQSMDLDGDGFVTMEEHKEAGKMMRKKHKEMKQKMREEHEAQKAADKEADGS